MNAIRNSVNEFNKWRALLNNETYLKMAAQKDREMDNIKEILKHGRENEKV